MSDTTRYDATYSKLHPNRDAAVAGLLNENGEIMLVRTHILPDMWQPVGGGIEDGESPEQSAAREIKEELGIDIDPSQSILTSRFPYDFGEGTIHFYTLRLSSELISKIAVNTNEIVEAKWFAPKNLQVLPCYPATKSYLLEYLKYWSKENRV